ncbi:MAG: hypothetical protein IKU37_06100 [Candidatus Gastranaerophilales bacterium]|nr:hypothetical protein [Candidatus Gastranaerophilales bacterium]
MWSLDFFKKICKGKEVDCSRGNENNSLKDYSCSMNGLFKPDYDDCHMDNFQCGNKQKNWWCDDKKPSCDYEKPDWGCNNKDDKPNWGCGDKNRKPSGGCGGEKPETPSVPAPSVTETPAPSATETPAPSTTETPAPSVTEGSSAPEASDVPVVSETPSVPEDSMAPEIPGKPSVPEESQTPSAPDVPNEPDVPRDPEDEVPSSEPSLDDADNTTGDDCGELPEIEKSDSFL